MVKSGADFDQAGLAVDLGLADECFVVFVVVGVGGVDDAIAGAFDRVDQVVAARRSGQVAHGALFRWRD